MARMRGRRGRRGFKIPVLTIAILGGQALLAKQASGGEIGHWLNHFQSFYTGYDFYGQQFRGNHLVIGWAPWFVKGLVSKVARPMGAAPRIPFGLPISIS